MKKIIFMILVIVLLAIFLSGCNENKSNNNGSSDINKFLGTWEGGSNVFNETWTFYSNSSLKKVTTYDWDETGEFTDVDWYTYEIDEYGEFCYRQASISFLMCYEFEFSENDTHLTLIFDELTYKFTKVE